MTAVMMAYCTLHTISIAPAEQKVNILLHCKVYAKFLNKTTLFTCTMPDVSCELWSSQIDGR